MGDGLKLPPSPQRPIAVAGHSQRQILARGRPAAEFQGRRVETGQGQREISHQIGLEGRSQRRPINRTEEHRGLPGRVDRGPRGGFVPDHDGEVSIGLAAQRGRNLECFRVVRNPHHRRDSRRRAHR